MIRIVDSVFVKSAVKSADYPPMEFTDIAFVGRSNVGKSSMINTILQRKMIAKVSSTPGKTKLINFFKIRFKDASQEDGYVTIVDLPGYGYAKVGKVEREKWKKMINTYFEKRESLAGVVVLVDIRHSANPKDIVMIEMLKNYNIPYLIVATKSDKIKKTLYKKELKKLATGLQIAEKDIMAFSSLKKVGVEKVLSWMEKIIL